VLQQVHQLLSKVWLYWFSHFYVRAGIREINGAQPHQVGLLPPGVSIGTTSHASPELQ